MTPNYHFMIFILLFLITCVRSQQNAKDCHKVPLIDNFDLNKATGRWYVQKIGDDVESKKKCLGFNTNAEKTKNGTVIHVEPIYKSTKKPPKYNIYQVGDTSAMRVEWLGMHALVAFTIGRIENHALSQVKQECQHICSFEFPLDQAWGMSTPFWNTFFSF